MNYCKSPNSIIGKNYQGLESHWSIWVTTLYLMQLVGLQKYKRSHAELGEWGGGVI